MSTVVRWKCKAITRTVGIAATRLAVQQRGFCQSSSSVTSTPKSLWSRFSEILWRDSKRQEALRTEREFCERLGLMTPDIAQRTHPVVLRRFLQPAEVDNLLEQMEEVKRQGIAGKRERHHGFGAEMVMGCWRTTYLHSDGIFKKRFPELQKRLLKAMFSVDSREWQVLKNRDPSRLNLRTIEFHEYVPPGQLAGETHMDAGSLITMDVYLAEPGVDYTGGDLVMREADGSLTAPSLHRGDAVLFISHKYHHVQPIITGKRVVLVTEIWDGPERSCSHRCTSHEPCDFKG